MGGVSIGALTEKWERISYVFFKSGVFLILLIFCFVSLACHQRKELSPDELKEEGFSFLLKRYEGKEVRTVRQKITDEGVFFLYQIEEEYGVLFFRKKDDGCYEQDLSTLPRDFTGRNTLSETFLRDETGLFTYVLFGHFPEEADTLTIELCSQKGVLLKNWSFSKEEPFFSFIRRNRMKRFP